MTMIEVFVAARIALYLTVAGYALFKKAWVAGVAMALLAGIAADNLLDIPAELYFVVTNLGGTLVAYKMYKYVNIRGKV